MTLAAKVGIEPWRATRLLTYRESVFTVGNFPSRATPAKRHASECVGRAMQRSCHGICIAAASARPLEIVSILAETVTFEHAHAPAHARSTERVWSRALMCAALAIVVAAPFELSLIAIPGGFTLTTSEVVTLIALVVAASSIVAQRQIMWPAPLILPGLVFLAVVIVAALVAPIEPGNSLRFAARMAVAASVCVLFVNVASTLERARTVVRVAVGTAAIVGAIAVLEQAELPAVMTGLTTFRPGFHVVAGQLRATSTLFYPTIASMYLEVAFALGLWLLFDAAMSRRRLEQSLVFVALVVIGAGISATFTRAGLIGVFASLILVAGLRTWRLPANERNLGLLGALSLTVGAAVILMHSASLLTVRLSTEGSQAWYGAEYQVPQSLRLETGVVHSLPVTVTNTGRVTWDSTAQPPFAMSYHWLRAGSDAVIEFDGERTRFPFPVRPGNTVSLPVTVIAPGEPGNYTLVWDVVHETRSWLSTEGVTPRRTDVQVTGAASSAVATRMTRLPSAPIRPVRLQLWQSALRMASERPWFGFGPDNFRHVYGRYAGFRQWDARVHANNMYLELLTGAGVIGFCALLWLVTAAGVSLWRRARYAPRSAAAVSSAALAAWMMIAGHGLVDSFLSFTTTYLTFAMAMGLAFSPGVVGGRERSCE